MCHLTLSMPWGETCRSPSLVAGQWDDHVHCRLVSSPSVHLQLYSTQHQDYYHQDMTLCSVYCHPAPKCTFWCWLWASSRVRAESDGAVCCRHPERDIRAWAEQEVADEHARQVQGRCKLPGCHPKHPLLHWHPQPLPGGSFPLSRELPPCPSSYSPCLLWDYKAPFSVLASLA